MLPARLFVPPGRRAVLAAAVAGCLLGAGCHDNGATGVAEPPAVAGTYHVSGTSPDGTADAPGVSFDGTVTLTQSHGELGGSATLTFAGGALGGATYVLAGPVSGFAVTVTGPEPHVVSIGVTDPGDGAVRLILNGIVAPGGDIDGEHVTDLLVGATAVVDEGAWHATRQ